jgi:hypothetical protein
MEQEVIPYRQKFHDYCREAYRHEYRVERIFNRLKSRVHIAPLFVKLNDQIAGLTYLLTLGVRVLTVMEFVLRRSLQTDQTKLLGLHPENKQKMTDKPTAERILKAFADVSLTIIKNAVGEEILRRLTSLSGLQEDILQRLGLDASLYGQLEIQEMGNWLGEWGVKELEKEVKRISKEPGALQYPRFLGIRMTMAALVVTVIFAAFNVLYSIYGEFK